MSANPMDRLKIAINKIKDKQTPDDQRLDNLKEICHWAEELDLAKDFFAVGGLDILRPLLEHQDDQIRLHTCSLLATLIQNNEQCQRIVVQSGLQEKLLKIVDQSDNPELKTKAVTAISGTTPLPLIRHPRRVLCSSHSRFHLGSTAIAEISRCENPHSSLGITYSTSSE